MTTLKVAIISNSDKLWSVHAWNRVFSSEILKNDYEVAGFWCCDQKFSNKKKLSAWKWYYNTLGWYNFIKLGFFVVVFKVSALIKSLSGKYHLSFESLCKANGISFYKTKTPNTPEFIRWLQKEQIDVLIIMVDHILKEGTLEAVKLATVNKHAGLLPQNKGLFPYFWAVVNDTKQGISFHKVNEAIDEGDLYFQEEVTSPSHTSSMIAFYYYVHGSYYKMLETAITNIKNKVTIKQNDESPHSYYSLPQKSDYLIFKEKGGVIMKWTDLLLPFHLFK